MTHKTKFKVGDLVVIGYGAYQHNAYAGFSAKVERCTTCCTTGKEKGAYRLQMLEWGNNERLDRFDESKLHKITNPSL